jgi:hypothetical protein
MGKNLCRSANVVRVVKSRGLRWGGHVAMMREIRNATEFYGETSWKTSLGRPMKRKNDNI